MARDIECFETNKTALQRALIRCWTGLPVSEITRHQKSFLYWMKPERSPMRS